MSTHIIRYSTKPEKSDENQALVEAVFAQLNAEKPEGLHYATFRMADGVNFVHVVSYDDDDADPLAPAGGVPGLPEGRRPPYGGRDTARRGHDRRFIRVLRRVRNRTVHA